MNERPILFKPEMVKAILEGGKKQTRRLVDGKVEECKDIGLFIVENDCPYGKPGDRLWVKEKHCFLDVIKSARKEMGHTIYNLQVEYSDGTERHHARYNEKPKQTRERGENKWRSSMFMPRWASRITLEIRSVRIERLQAISEEDAKAEGISDATIQVYLGMIEAMNQLEPQPARDLYKALWERIHGPGSWDLNPWVWVIEFKRVESKRL